jgi:hypothetical protein
MPDGRFDVDQTISYGGFEFPFTAIEVVPRAVYAADRRTRVGTEYTFNVSGVLAGNDARDFVERERAMRKALATERQPFRVIQRSAAPGGEVTSADLYFIVPQWFDGDGDPLFPPDGTQQQVVIDWGPYTDPPKLTRFTGGLSARYTWTCRATVKDCEGGGSESDVSALVRRIAYSQDINGYTTRTISGKLTVRASGAPADKWRYWVTPELPAGFVRVVPGDFEESEDQLELTFRFVDREQPYIYPRPVTNCEARFRVSHQRGLKVSMEMTGFMEAPPSVTKDVLVRRIADLIDSRFPKEIVSFIESQSIGETVYGANRLEFSITATTVAGWGPDDAKTKLVDFGPAVALIGKAPPGEAPDRPLNSAGQTIVDPYGLGAKPMSPLVPTYDSCYAGGEGQVDLDTPEGSVGVGRGLDASVIPPPTGTELSPIPAGDDGEEGEDYPEPEVAELDRSGTSDGHQEAPFIEWVEVLMFGTDNRLVYFEPKKRGQAAVRQQAGNPIRYVVQAGHYRRAASSASQLSDAYPPPQPFLKDTADLLFKNVGALTPEGGGFGEYNVYRMEWLYAFRMRDAFGEGDIEDPVVRFPKDPRRPEGLQDDTVLPTPEGLQAVTGPTLGGGVIPIDPGGEEPGEETP